MDLVNNLHSVQMIDPRVQPNLIHHHDSSFFGSCVELTHCRGDVTGSDDVSLAFDSRFDDLGMIGIWDQRDDNVVFCYCGFERCCVVDVE